MQELSAKAKVHSKNVPIIKSKIVEESNDNVDRTKVTLLLKNGDEVKDGTVNGTVMKTRPNFVKMIDDAMAGKIDIIYCKSISRFSRNAAECQETVRMLKTKLVEVIFEKEQLSSFNPMSEMVFNFMTIIAQEESRSISENITWALDRLAEKGIRKFGKRAIFGYDEVDGVLIPNVYAIAVKMVFEEYAAGTPAAKIAEYLSQMGSKIN